MKSKALLFIFITLVLVAEFGCKKCMCCGQITNGTISFTKNNDTVISVLTNTSLKKYYDTVNYYIGMGFQQGLSTTNMSITSICGKQNTDYAIQSGAECHAQRPDSGGECP